MIASMRALRRSAISAASVALGSRVTRSPELTSKTFSESRPMAPRTFFVRAVDRQVDRLGVAEDALALVDRHVVVRAGRVELGHGNGARHPYGGALLPEQSGGAVDAVRGGDDEDRRVRPTEAGPQVADEVRVPGVSRRLMTVPLLTTDAAPRATERSCSPRWGR